MILVFLLILKLAYVKSGEKVAPLLAGYIYFQGRDPRCTHFLSLALATTCTGRISEHVENTSLHERFNNFNVLFDHVLSAVKKYMCSRLTITQ